MKFPVTVDCVVLSLELMRPTEVTPLSNFYLVLRKLFPKWKKDEHSELGSRIGSGK